MSSENSVSESLSDTDRGLLRRSVREFLAARWPAEGAVERSGDAKAVATVWRGLAGQGLAALGSGSEAGLREIAAGVRGTRPRLVPGAAAWRGGGQPRARSAAVECGARAARGHASGQGRGCAGARRASMAMRPPAGRRCAAMRCRASLRSSRARRRRRISPCSSTHGIAVVASGAPGVTIKATPGLAVPALSELAFDNTPATRVSCAARNARRRRADGAARLRRPRARRGATRVRNGGRARQGPKAVRPVHRPVPGDPAQARQLPDQPRRRADGARDRGRGARRRQSGLADLRLGGASRSRGRRCAQVSIETHRALGAIGYAEEHEAPRHFRRVHADLARFGGVPRARAELADFLLGPA